MNIFVTGATGLVGKRLLPALTNRGDTVVALSRRATPSTPSVEWITGDPCMPGPWIEKLQTCDAVVHLAGEPIMGHRWSDTFLKRVRDSRVASTRIIAEALAKHPAGKVFIAGSAVGIYGANPGDMELTEDSQPGSDVMASITKDWEAAAEPAKAAGVRVAQPRTGIVLDRAGGALPKMALPFKMFAGGRIGNGKQYLAWIHHADMTGLLLFALDHLQLHGPFNATARTPVRNAEFSRELARVLHRPNWLPAPKFALRIVIGRAAEIAVGGQNAVPRKALDAGYRFRFETVGEALNNLLSRDAQRSDLERSAARRG